MLREPEKRECLASAIPSGWLTGSVNLRAEDLLSAEFLSDLPRVDHHKSSRSWQTI